MLCTVYEWHFLAIYLEQKIYCHVIDLLELLLFALKNY